jgi:hypothetical protein
MTRAHRAEGATGEAGPGASGSASGSSGMSGSSGVTALWHADGRDRWLEKTVLDCPDPRALAEFYAEVLGRCSNNDSLDWVVIGREPGDELAFQPPLVPPRSDPERPQPLHLDIRVDDERRPSAVLALGARKLAEHERGFRCSPTAHPFCLVFG